jgi:hypothetical protein
MTVGEIAERISKTPAEAASIREAPFADRQATPFNSAIYQVIDLQ